jgi:hypothetical protein
VLRERERERRENENENERERERGRGGGGGKEMRQFSMPNSGQLADFQIFPRLVTSVNCGRFVVQADKVTYLHTYLTYADVCRFVVQADKVIIVMEVSLKRAVIDRALIEPY